MLACPAAKAVALSGLVPANRLRGLSVTLPEPAAGSRAKAFLVSSNTVDLNRDGTHESFPA